eukprot:1489862-Alexandrium_andersonii.AAC.1
MSASLVGSEMCIRDSPRTPRPLGRAPEGGLQEGVGFLGASCSFLRVSRAVSYTHLTLPTICSV